MIVSKNMLQHVCSCSSKLLIHLSTQWDQWADWQKSKDPWQFQALHCILLEKWYLTITFTLKVKLTQIPTTSPLFPAGAVLKPCPQLHTSLYLHLSLPVSLLFSPQIRCLPSIHPSSRSLHMFSTDHTHTQPYLLLFRLYQHIIEPIESSKLSNERMLGT